MKNLLLLTGVALLFATAIIGINGLRVLKDEAEQAFTDLMPHEWQGQGDAENTRNAESSLRQEVEMVDRDLLPRYEWFWSTGVSFHDLAAQDFRPLREFIAELDQRYSELQAASERLQHVNANSPRISLLLRLATIAKSDLRAMEQLKERLEDAGQLQSSGNRIALDSTVNPTAPEILNTQQLSVKSAGTWKGDGYWDNFQARLNGELSDAELRELTELRISMQPTGQ